MVEQSATRKLAAILAADVVGFSRLVGDDEEGTLARLRSYRDTLIDPTIERHRGRIVKTTGDGLLVEFHSVVDAVRAAIELQTALNEQNQATPNGQRIDFRMGINLGDVVEQDDDLLGDGVNVAARLEGLALPGGICLSRAARDQVRDRLDIALEDMGEVEVKNIARPVRVFRVSVENQPVQVPPGPPVPTLTGADARDKPSIAVLPFENMSGDPEQEYFSDGVSEDITTALSQIRWLRVIARNSAFTFKGTSVDVRKVADDLGMRYVLEGSVRKSGSRVRITAQLVDGTTGDHHWANRYDRELEDIFAVQDEITETIVGALEPEMGKAERQRAKSKQPENLSAWENYQRGLWHLYQFDAVDAAEARRMFERAIELDGSFSAAYAGLATANYVSFISGHATSPQEILADAIRDGKKAVALDDEDPIAHWVLGTVYMMKGQRDVAVAELNKAVALNPSYANAHFGLGSALAASGELNEAIEEVDTAIRLSPPRSDDGGVPGGSRPVFAPAQTLRGGRRVGAQSSPGPEHADTPHLRGVDRGARPPWAQ